MIEALVLSRSRRSIGVVVFALLALAPSALLLAGRGSLVVSEANVQSSADLTTTYVYDPSSAPTTGSVTWRASAFRSFDPTHDALRQRIRRSAESLATKGGRGNADDLPPVTVTFRNHDRALGQTKPHKRPRLLGSCTEVRRKDRCSRPRL